MRLAEPALFVGIADEPRRRQYPARPSRKRPSRKRKRRPGGRPAVPVEINDFLSDHNVSDTNVRLQRAGESGHDQWAQRTSLTLPARISQSRTPCVFAGPTPVSTIHRLRPDFRARPGAARCFAAAPARETGGETAYFPDPGRTGRRGWKRDRTRKRFYGITVAWGLALADFPRERENDESDRPPDGWPGLTVPRKARRTASGVGHESLLGIATCRYAKVGGLML